MWLVGACRDDLVDFFRGGVGGVARRTGSSPEVSEVVGRGGFLSVFGRVQVLPCFYKRGESRLEGVASLEVGGALPVVTPESRRQLANGFFNS